MLVAYIHSYYYVFVYFWLTYFISSSICPNTILLIIFISKQRRWFFLSEFFLGLESFYYFQQSEVIVWSILTIIHIIYPFLFQKFCSKLNLCCHSNHYCSSRKWQSEIVISFVRFIDTLMRLYCYIFLLAYIIYQSFS